MVYRILFSALLFLATSASVSLAGDVVEIRVLEGQADNSRELTIPKDAKQELSLTTHTDAAGDYYAQVNLGEKTLLAKGTVKSLNDGKYRVQIDYSSHENFSVQQVSTSIEISAADPKAIGRLLHGNGSQIIVLEVKPDLKK